VDVLSQQAPGLPEALERALVEGVPYVILDGKVFVGDRCSETVTSVKGEQIHAWYSGKAHRHGGNVRAVMRPDGLPLWAGPAEPGSVNDMTAARALPALYRAAALGLPFLPTACNGVVFTGASSVAVAAAPYRPPGHWHQPQADDQRARHAERPLRGDTHGGCGGRAGETHQEQSRQGAPVRPDRRFTGPN
jgi:hypothetical protein